MLSLWWLQEFVDKLGWYREVEAFAPNRGGGFFIFS
jgi:hypothetical protein